MDELQQRAGDQPLPTPNDRLDIQSMVIADLAARREIGVARYGTALQAFNGRDGLRDAYEEAMDLTVYLRQVLEERADLAAEIHRLGDELARSWATHLNAALAIVTVRQIVDAEQLCARETEHGAEPPHGSKCGYGLYCHSTEAHAAITRVRADLEALRDRGPELDAVTGTQP